MFRNLIAGASGATTDSAPARRKRRRRGCGHECCQQRSETPRQDAAPLTAFRSGDKLVVDRIERGPLACRLYAMGLTPGTPVAIDASGSGSVRFTVRGSSLVLSREEAEKILCVLPETVTHTHDSLEAMDEAPLARDLPPPGFD